MTLTEISSLLESGELTAFDHVRSTLHSLDKLADTPWSNLIAARDDERALAEARARSADILYGKRRGPLDGIAVVVKDNIDVAGLPTRAGSAVFDDIAPADRDADIVLRLRDAGAIIVGKTHLHELAYGSIGDVNAAGPACHPQDPALITGGSSSGSAALVALEAVPLAVGTDTGCSVRAPAALTGITGLMPRLGLLPTTGVLPVSPTFDHIGFFTATASDAQLAWSALQRTAHSTPTAAHRIAVPINPLLTTSNADATLAVDRAVASLRTLGHTVVPMEIPGIEDLAAQYPIIVGFEMHTRYSDQLKSRPGSFQPMTRERLSSVAAYTSREYEKSLRRVEQLRPRVLAALAAEDIDALALGTTPFPAPPIGLAETNGESVSAAILRLCVPFSVLGTPAVSVPYTLGKLPVGVQLVGVTRDEEALLDLAVAITTGSTWSG